MFIKAICGTACIVILIAAAAKYCRPGNAPEYGSLVPQCLLALVHAPEVHKELQLSEEQINGLETMLCKVDAQWFPARILPADEQLAVNHELETQVWEWFSKSITPTHRKRLQQLEYQAQGGRMLLRSDVAKQVGVKSSQLEKLAALARRGPGETGSLSHSVR